MPRFSAIDIGSNAIRMIVGEVVDHKVEVLKKIRAPLRLGHDVFMDGRISDKTLMEAEEVFRSFAMMNKKYRVKKCRAVATSALREAQNRNEFVRKMAKSSRIKVEVINGTTEAEIIFAAINREVDLTGKQAALIDIGGGSVEVTICQNEKVTSSKSFPAGTVRLIESLNKRRLNENHIDKVLHQFLAPMKQHLDKKARDINFDFAVGTGGNLEAMARLKIQLLKRTPNTNLTLDELVDITRILRGYSIQQRIEKLELRPDRADVIIPALLIVKTIMRQLHINKLMIPGVGLRDGLLWSIAQSTLA